MGKSYYDFLDETRTSVEEIAAKMLFIKKEGKNRAELRELVTQASVAFLHLRQINRIILQEEDRTKQETDAAKLPVDQTTLQLNNLLYQKNHYLKAINACKDFKSKYPDIDLVPEDEFFRDAPDEFKGDTSIKEDPHKRMLERLNFELYQRKGLCKQRELLEARKKMLQESIANRRKFLSSLPSHLKALKKASLPVQQQLGILHTKRMKQHQLAELLPAPLYIIYSQLLSQKEAFDDNIDLEILGSAKDAQAVARQQTLKDSGINVGGHEENKVEEDPQEEEDDSQRRRKRAKKSHMKETAEGVYHAHPLSVLWHIYNEHCVEDEKPTKLLSIRFEYLMKLNVVCAGAEGAQDGPLDLLTNLFPDDTGLDLPTQVAKLSAGLDFSYDAKRSLHPFKWVQHLAGLDFLPECPPSIVDGTLTGDEYSKGMSLSNGLAAYRQQHRVQTILKKLRSRRIAHVALKEQLDALTNLKLPQLRFLKVPWAAYIAKCSLQSWTEITLSGHQKSSFGTYGMSNMSPVMLFAGESAVSPRNIECAREDGELPLGGVGTGSSVLVSKYSGLSERKTSSIKDKSYMGGFSAAQSEDVFEGFGKPPLTNFEGPEVNLADEFGGNIPSETDVLAEDNIEDMDTTMQPEISDLPPSHKLMSTWEECGTRMFCAVLRRDDGGKPVDLEAQVKVSCEYPIRPPHFTLRLVSQGLFPALPAAPVGVLDMAEASRTSFVSMDGFNELCAMEIEVNIRALEALPRSQENHILAHQFCLLTKLFDVYVDQQLPHHGKNVSLQAHGKDIGSLEVVGCKNVSRLIRGRDRQMLIF